jgi:hypothetical protein
MGADAASVFRDEEHDATPPVGEEIHMPAPSIIPLINAFGLALMIVSITLAWYLVAIGGVIFVVSAIRWILDVRTEIAALPADHGDHH